jgi:hypothetical protein
MPTPTAATPALAVHNPYAPCLCGGLATGHPHDPECPRSPVRVQCQLPEEICVGDFVLHLGDRSPEHPSLRGISWDRSVRWDTEGASERKEWALGFLSTLTTLLTGQHVDGCTCERCRVFGAAATLRKARLVEFQAFSALPGTWVEGPFVRWGPAAMADPGHEESVDHARSILRHFVERFVATLATAITKEQSAGVAS